MVDTNVDAAERQTRWFQDNMQILTKRDAISRTVALWVVRIFGLSLLYAFILLTVVICKSYHSVKDIEVLKDGVLLLTTVSSIFTPLLAFVLGYYFNQDKHNADQDRRYANDDARELIRSRNDGSDIDSNADKNKSGDVALSGN